MAAINPAQVPPEKFKLPDVTADIITGEFESGNSKSKDGVWGIDKAEAGDNGFRITVIHNKRELRSAPAGVFWPNFDLNYRSNDGKQEANASMHVEVNNMLSGVQQGADEMLHDISMEIARCRVVADTIMNWIDANPMALPALKPIMKRGGGYEPRYYTVANLAAARGLPYRNKRTGKMEAPIHRIRVKVPTISDREAKAAAAPGATADVRNEKIACTIDIDDKSYSYGSMTRGEFNDMVFKQRFLIDVPCHYSAFILKANGEITVQLIADQIILKTHKPGQQLTDAEIEENRKLANKRFDRFGVKATIEVKDESGAGKPGVTQPQDPQDPQDLQDPQGAPGEPLSDRASSPTNGRPIAKPAFP